ncbi:MAG: TolC family protein [Bacteroidia bacterium]|nr:TolC family protein [Bacteroidia bacterium]
MREDELILQVTLRYQELLSAEKILLISSQKKNTLMLQYQMAEKSFNQGNLSIEELARVTELAGVAETGFIQARQSVETVYTQLMSLVGIKNP